MGKRLVDFLQPIRSLLSPGVVCDTIRFKSAHSFGRVSYALTFAQKRAVKLL